jgi:hypothetical protein
MERLETKAYEGMAAELFWLAYIIGVTSPQTTFG